MRSRDTKNCRKNNTLIIISQIDLGVICFKDKPIFVGIIFFIQKEKESR